MTPLTRDQVDDLVERVAKHGLWSLRLRRALDPHRAVIAVVVYLRHHLSQPLPAELASANCQQFLRSTAASSPRTKSRATNLASVRAKRPAI